MTNKPKHPAPVIVPDSEFSTHRQALSRELDAQGVGGWIAFGDDGAVHGPGHIRYLTNIHPHFEPIFLLGRADGACLLVVGPETLGYAGVIRAPGISDVIVSSLFGHPDEEYPTTSIVSGIDFFRDFFRGVENIGLVGFSRVPYPIYGELSEFLSEHHARSVDATAYRLRSIKSDAEQAVMDVAYQIALQGILAAAAVIRPDATERSVAAEAEAAMRRAGAEGFGIDTMVASGIANTQPIISRSTHRFIQKNDLVVVTVAPRYEGYHAAMARPFMLRSDAEMERIVAVAKTAQRRCFDLLAVGVPGSTAEKAARAEVKAGRTGAEFPYVGLHSIGTAEFEPPIFAAHANDPIRPGMALSIDIPLYHAAWGGMRLEDGYSVTGDGARPRVTNYQECVPLVL